MNRFVLFFVAAVFCATASAALADDAAQKKVIHDYVLSMDKINAMQAMKDEEKNLIKNNPAFVKQVTQAEITEKNYGTEEDKLANIPPLVALYRKHGLTPADVVIMPQALLCAGMAVQIPSLASKLSAQTSPAQIAFYKAHAAELHKIRWLNGGG